MVLYVVRHGETDWNKVKRVQGHTDIPLNEYGRHLARETAKGLKETRIDLAITSPLIRAKETAQIILGTRQIPLLEDPRIKEIGFGEYEGVSCNGEDPVSRAFRLFFNAPGEYIAPKGAETIEELYERTGDFLKELCEKEEWQQKNILISTHGAAMTALLNRIRAVEVETPEEKRGDVMGDLSSRRGVIQGMDDLVGGGKSIKAEVPLAEMFGYATQLRSLTQGRATYTMEFKHYAEAPRNVADAVIADKTK